MPILCGKNQINQVKVTNSIYSLAFASELNKNGTREDPCLCKCAYYWPNLVAAHTPCNILCSVSKLPESGILCKKKHWVSGHFDIQVTICLSIISRGNPLTLFEFMNLMDVY